VFPSEEIEFPPYPGTRGLPLRNNSFYIDRLDAVMMHYIWFTCWGSYATDSGYTIQST